MDPSMVAEAIASQLRAFKAHGGAVAGNWRDESLVGLFAPGSRNGVWVVLGDGDGHDDGTINVQDERTS